MRQTQFILLRSLLLLFMTGTLNVAPAQSWITSGSEWYYDYNNFWVTGYIHLNYTGDTLIEANTFSNDPVNCQILTKTLYSHNYETNESDTTVLGKEYFYSNDDTVFLFRNGKFYTLYDFSAQAGDSWQIPQTYETGCDTTGTLQVLAAGDTVINDLELQYIEVEPMEESEWTIYGTIIEKIGPVDHYILPEQNCMTDLMEGGPMRCYLDDFFQYSTGLATECDFLVSVDELSTTDIKVYPNPARDFFIIDNPQGRKLTVFVRNLQGQSLLEKKVVNTTAEVDIGMLKQGTYLISLLDNELNTTEFLIIKI